MFIEHTFYVSVSKKHTQTEVFGFEVKTEFFIGLFNPSTKAEYRINVDFSALEL